MTMRIADKIYIQIHSICYRQSRKDAEKGQEVPTTYSIKNLATSQNLAIHKQAYDMVPHLWLATVPHMWLTACGQCVDMFGVAENFKTLLVNSMEK